MFTLLLSFFLEKWTLLLNFVFVLLSLLSFRAARSVVRLVFFDPVKNVNFYLLSFFHLVNFFHFSSIMPATPLMFCWGGNLLWTSVWQIFSLFCNIFCNNFSYVHVHKKILTTLKFNSKSQRQINEKYIWSAWFFANKILTKEMSVVS